MTKKIAIFVGALLIVAGGLPGIVLAMPTQEEVFQSVNQNMNETVDVSKAVPYLLVAAGLAILIGLFNYYRKRQTFPRRLNSPGKLNREICKAIHLRSVELKQLKVMAEDQEVEHPLTLILCPSLLGKAIRSQNVKVDRAVVKGIVSRLKESLAEK
jgi:hypothetical protein